VIATRKGNPKDLKDWDDLIEDDVEVITPNPFTSGGARWNVLAAYGAKSEVGANDQAGLDYLNELFRHVPVQDDSARKSLQTFTSGKGDAILAYENEAIFAQQNDQPLDYTVPDDTILIENPVAVTKTSKHPEQAQAFLDFLFTETAQRIFADNGYRPVVKGVAEADEFPEPSGLFTIADLGGWTDLAKRFFDPEVGVLLDIERELAGPAPGGAPRPPGPGLAWHRAPARLRHAVPEPDRADPARRRRRPLHRQRVGRVLAGAAQPPGARGPALHARRRADRDGDQRGHGHGDRVGAGP
jgi:hypothetical protein